MSQRNSGYQRKEGDQYETPGWVTHALIPHLPRRPIRVWEPAAGSGKMVDVLRASGLAVDGSDIATGTDFLNSQKNGFDAIITNPPYSLAAAFIDHALDLTSPRGMIAMLLRTDFDHAKTRQRLFSQCTAFAKKLVLTKRIVWFEGGKKGPSFNHAWFVWDWRHNGPPVLAYHQANSAKRSSPP
jgi:hypothetical protein